MELTLSRDEVAKIILDQINARFPETHFNKCNLSNGYGIEFATVIHEKSEEESK